MDGRVPRRQRDVQAGRTRGDSLAQTFRVSSHQPSLIRRFRREQSGMRRQSELVEA
jgi:hypothetical protein